MNRKYIGDAFDHWKGSLLERLQSTHALIEFAVDPMASDLCDWGDEDFAVFARLLRVSQSQIIKHTNHLGERLAYFEELPHRGDLFLDPDTGVATGKVKDRLQYIEPIEVAFLLENSPDRLLIVYQHVRAQKVEDRVNEVLHVLKEKIQGLEWCSYESGTVAMLFLARKVDRVKKVQRSLEELLGPHAKERVRSGESCNKA